MKIIVLVGLALFSMMSTWTVAADLAPTIIARCGETSGYAYYAERKIVPREKAGWQKDGITGGKVVLARLPNGSLDLIYYDRTESVRSSVKEGAVITLALSNDEELTVIIRYSGETSEIFSFWLDRRGRLQYAQLQSKTSPYLTKQALFVGECSEINFRRVLD